VTRQVGDVDQIRSERDDLTSEIADLRSEQRELRDDLADRDVDARARWLREALTGGLSPVLSTRASARGLWRSLRRW
jgi:hypothetical protein